MMAPKKFLFEGGAMHEIIEVTENGTRVTECDSYTAAEGVYAAAARGESLTVTWRDSLKGLVVMQRVREIPKVTAATLFAQKGWKQVKR